MRILLRDGKFHGTYANTGECDREFVKDGQVYKATDDTSPNDAMIFEFDAVATKEHASIHSHA
jgi:hypothetical protein